MKKSVLVLLVSLCLSTVSLLSWDSKKWPKNGTEKDLSTHTFLSRCGIEMLRRDLTPETLGTLFPQQQDAFNAVLSEIAGQYYYEFLHGSVHPDFRAGKPLLYQDHFWDPDPDNNFTDFPNDPNSEQEFYSHGSSVLRKNLAYVADTAETRVREYFAEAVYLWRTGNHATAIYYLGLASHYLQDICCPVHSTNMLGIVDNDNCHVKFEHFVEQRKGSYRINSIDDPIGVDDGCHHLDRSWYRKAIVFKYQADFLRELCIACGVVSKDVIVNYGQRFYGALAFAYAAPPTMAIAQKAQSLLIFAFVHAVISPIPIANAGVETTFTIKIATPRGFFKGTANAAFVGIELRDGRRFEKYCGNVHLQNHIDTYHWVIPGVTGADVRKIWVRKANIFIPVDKNNDNYDINSFIPMMNDDWTISNISCRSSDKSLDFTYNTEELRITGNEGFIFDVTAQENHNVPSPLKDHSRKPR